MCGLAGYSGLKNQAQRLKLVKALGKAIDRRGGHAAGYVSLPSPDTGKAPSIAKRIGTWDDASTRFHYGAASGEVCLMHSRFATCGKRDALAHAHPFIVRRGEANKAVLYGAHNGVLQGTFGSALKNKRDHTVDSRELLELMADNDMSGIKNLTGYGVVTWITPDSGMVYVVKLSDMADFHLVTLVGGGIAWASTWAILGPALDAAGLMAEHTLELPKVGTVYAMGPDGAFATLVDNLSVGVNDWETEYKSYFPTKGKKWWHKSDIDLDYTAEDRAWDIDLDYTAEDRAWDKLIRDKEAVDELNGTTGYATQHAWRPDGKLLSRGELMPYKPVRRPLSEITLDNMTDEELDTITEDEWEAIAYKDASELERTKKPKYRVGK